MQLEDEELGLGGASNARTPESDEDDLEPVASTSRSPSPDPASPGSRPRATAADAAALADSLADLDLSQPATGEAAPDFDDAPIPKRSKKKQRKKAQIVPGFDDDEDFEGGSGGTATPELPRGDDVDLDDVVGMAPSGGRRRKKGKGRQADFFADLDGSGAGQDDDEAVEVPVPLGLGRSGVGLDSSDEDRPSLRNARGKKKGRKAKQTPLAESRTPTTGDEARVETAPADTARGDLEQVDEPSALGDKELSKKEKRRLKEAAKKAGPGDDFVSLRFLIHQSPLGLSDLPFRRFRAGLQRMQRVVPFTEQAVPAHRRHRSRPCRICCGSRERRQGRRPEKGRQAIEVAVKPLFTSRSSALGLYVLRIWLPFESKGSCRADLRNFSSFSAASDAELLVDRGIS